MKKLLLTSALALGLLSIAASASAYDSGGKGFANSWTSYDAGGSGFNTWNLEYGFNKFAIDEDFIHAFHNSKAHSVKLTNDNGNNNHTGAGDPSTWATIDVRHSGSFVYYDHNF
ncbi:hypothetical protein [Paenibacillus glacialis]|uniref:Lactococcin 972 family bacteriocin n=1 Tax=Paenibacillus glacialis TaxID=494026 RepID=A0A168JLI3_9BACL|nr:hypothetical protein [Paenibacillus glacialis]OAB40795.1 hypothetical protein PGLA_17650 [Paenibacillus glacialis]